MFVSDRHSGSFDYFIGRWAGKEPLTLILLDYHHDMGPGPSSPMPRIPESGDVKSFNWLGGLVTAGIVEDIYWVSGRDLLLPNRNARKAWLERKTEDDPPDNRKMKRESIHIVDWSDLKDLYAAGQFSGDLALSLDLDILTVDPGPSPEGFLDEMLDFIDELQPAVLTMALSAAYQPDPAQAWDWFSHALGRLGKDRTVILAGGPENPVPEGNEERRRWEQWAEKEIITDFSAFFAPGAEIWNMAPALFWQGLAPLSSLPADSTMERLLVTLERSLNRRIQLRDDLSAALLKGLAREASDELIERLGGCGASREAPVPPESDAERGVAVRFISGFEDRGCIAYYRGIEDPSAVLGAAVENAAFHDPRYEPIRAEELDDLDVEVTLFGSFVPLASPEDFIPSLDSLILEIEGERTLLQASLALERNLSRRQFLQALARKSGLGEDGWKRPDAKLYSAPSLSVRLPVLQKEM